MPDLLRAYTVWNVIERNACVRPEQAALVGDLGVLTHHDLLTEALGLAAQLTQLGVSAGDRVAVLAENHIRIYALLGAAARIGAILVPLNWRLQAAELNIIVDDCRPILLVCDAATRDLAEALAEGLDPLQLLMLDQADGSIKVLAPRTPGSGLSPEPEADAVLFLIYTAATDGVPRGVMLTHGNIIASAAQLGYGLKLCDQAVFLGNLPLFHIMALSFAFAVQFAGGATVVRPRFDAADAALAIAKYGVTMAGTFPPMLAAMLDAAEEGGHDLSTLRFCLGLEAPVTIARLERKWPAARFWNGFGQTETSGMVSLGQAQVKPGASGQPSPLSNIAIGAEDGTLLPESETGEILVRGPSIMKGYWNRAAETAATFLDGWHHTGDLGRLEGGWLFYAGRSPKKALIKSGGENVYPAEVEQVLKQHPHVTEAAVFGVPDARWGEVVVAAVVLMEGVHPDPEALRAFVGSRIAAYKRPKHIIFRKRLPRDSNNQLDRQTIAKDHASAARDE